MKPSLPSTYIVGVVAGGVETSYRDKPYNILPSTSNLREAIF